ncbi:rod shape-determining protein MreD [Inquilinus sp. CAU 1745]|uniref:rod shape-determining protein MreD n=1 Tax=Inquilinus sp. CAU 1745 TaxID=3140369 RepID=UPI00325AA787
MIDVIWHKTDEAIRHAIPAVTTIMLVFLAVTPLRLPSYGALAPVLPLVAIYYWAIHRPDLMPFTLVFAVGLLQDLVIGAPLGLHALVFLIIHWTIVAQRRFLVGRSFFVLWWGFAMIAGVAAALEWATFSVYHATFMPMETAALRALLTIALFPAIAWVFIQVHRLVLRSA